MKAFIWDALLEANTLRPKRKIGVSWSSIDIVKLTLYLSSLANKNEVLLGYVVDELYNGVAVGVNMPNPLSPPNVTVCAVSYGVPVDCDRNSTLSHWPSNAAKIGILSLSKEQVKAWVKSRLKAVNGLHAR